MGFPAVFGLAFNIGAVSLYNWYTNFVVRPAEIPMSKVALPQPGLSGWAFVAFRASASALIIFTALTALLSKNSTRIVPHYFSGTKLKPISYELTGVRRFATFTVQTWCLMGIYFVLATVVSASQLLGTDSGVLASPVVGRVMWVLYEACLSYSMLVTVIVTYLLVPLTLKRSPGSNLTVFFGWRPLVMHNANVLIMFTELLLNRMPVEPGHLPMVLIWGVCYLSYRLDQILKPFAMWQRASAVYGLMALIVRVREPPAVNGKRG